jgi:hypothetical protein
VRLEKSSPDAQSCFFYDSFPSGLRSVVDKKPCSNLPMYYALCTAERAQDFPIPIHGSVVVGIRFRLWVASHTRYNDGTLKKLLSKLHHFRAANCASRRKQTSWMQNNIFLARARAQGIAELKYDNCSVTSPMPDTGRSHDRPVGFHCRAAARIGRSPPIIRGL